MSLIKCVECGNMISEKSEICIHCGCPTSESTNKNELNIDYKVIDNYLKSGNPVHATKYLMDTYSIDATTAKKYVIEYRDKYFKKNNNTSTTQSNQPKCPTCGSTRIQKISGGRKLMGAIGFGLLSKTAKSQFECLNCKYKW